MLMNNFTYRLLGIFFLGISFVTSTGCSNKPESITVYAGKGLKNAVEEIKQQFEEKENVEVNVTYAGSETLLKTLSNTRKGDAFIPGSSHYIDKAKKHSLVANDYYVAKHVPTFIVRANLSEHMTSFHDLLVPGVKLAIGNKDMCAIGRVGESILKDSPPEDDFRSNIVVKGSTVNELLNMVIDQEVDAALVWEDMLMWDTAKDLGHVVIPDRINKVKEIRVAALSTSLHPDWASRFTDFVASEGREIFVKHGFGK